MQLFKSKITKKNEMLKYLKFTIKKKEHFKMYIYLYSIK